MDSPQFGNLESKLKDETNISEKINLLSVFWEGNGGAHSSRLEFIIKGVIDEIEQTNNKYALGQCYLILGWLKYDQNLNGESLYYFTEAQKLFIKYNDLRAQLQAAIGKATAYKQNGDYGKSFEEYQGALEVAEDALDGDYKAAIMLNIGVLLSDLKQNAEALDYFMSAKSIMSPSSSKLPSLNYNLAKNFRLMGDLDQAQEYIKKTMDLIGSDDTKMIKTKTYLEMGIISRLLGKINEGSDFLNQALDFAEGLSNRRIRGQIFLELGTIKEYLEEYQEALVFLSEALDIFSSLGVKDYEVQVLNIMFDIYGALGDYASAYLVSNKYQSIGSQNYHTEITNRLGVIKAQQTRKENLIYQDLYDRISTIGEIGQIITSSFNTEEIGKIIYTNLKNLMTIDNLYICLYVEEEKSLVVKKYIRNGELLPEFITSITNKDFKKNKFFTTQKGFLINDLSKHNEPLLKDFLKFNFPQNKDVNSLLCAPLITRGKVLGWLTIESLKTDAYSPYHLDILNVIASYTAIALENKNLITNVNELATIDPITGIFNRKQIVEQAEDEFIRFKRYSDPFSVILIDIDQFKKINDTYGHHIGDFLLEQTAKVFSMVIRATDILGRIGGDEFFLLLPSTKIEGAKILARRLLDAIAKQGYTIENQTLHIRVSMGLTQVYKNDSNLNDLIDRAEEALDDAKCVGGNTYKVVHIES